MSVLDSLQIEDLNEVWQQIAGIIGLDNAEAVVRKNTLAGSGDNRAPFAELIIKNF